MRVCIVGCGAVGSLFAANLATLDDVEVWAFDLARDHVDAHRRTEIDMITGSLVREAHRLGVPVPLHETMERLVKAKEDSW